jgi:ferredoxin-NADP reductase
MAPAGNFTLPQDYSVPIVFLSGGIGVTPFRSMIKYAADKQLPLKIVMFDSNRNQANILYKDEFDSCAKVNTNLRIIYTITEEEDKNLSSDWKGEKGYIDAVMLAKYLTKFELVNSIFYICGPPAMLNAMQKLLSEEIGVPDERIRIEEFTGY